MGRTRIDRIKSLRDGADFLIGTHAFRNGLALLTFDARIYGATFPQLSIFTPSELRQSGSCVQQAHQSEGRM
jgi:predicted nucleic acid-binding protein